MRVHITPLAFAVMLEYLLEGASINELAEKTGLCRKSVERYTGMMYRRKNKLIHVYDWKCDSRGRWVIRVYKWGNRPDKKKPAPKTQAQKDADSRANRGQRKLTKAFKAMALLSDDEQFALAG